MSLYIAGAQKCQVKASHFESTRDAYEFTCTIANSLIGGQTTMTDLYKFRDDLLEMRGLSRPIPGASAASASEAGASAAGASAAGEPETKVMEKVKGRRRCNKKTQELEATTSKKPASDEKKLKKKRIKKSRSSLDLDNIKQECDAPPGPACPESGSANVEDEEKNSWEQNEGEADCDCDGDQVASGVGASFFDDPCLCVGESLFDEYD